MLCKGEASIPTSDEWITHENQRMAPHEPCHHWRIVAILARKRLSRMPVTRQIVARLSPRKEADAMKADLDATDWKILRELQNDGRMTNVELSRRVGISAPPCLRRVKRLEESGIIRGYRALLNAPTLGYGVVAFCLVGLHRQSEVDIKAFADLAQGWSIVRRAWMMSGETDFLLHCVAKDLSSFQEFVLSGITAAPNVDTVRTALTIRQVKDEGLVGI